MVTRETVTVTTSSGAGTAFGIIPHNGLLLRVKLVPASGGSATFTLSASNDGDETLYTESSVSSNTIVYPKVATTESGATTYYSLAPSQDGEQALLKLVIASASPDGDYSVIVDVMR